MSSTDERIVSLKFDDSGFAAGANKAIGILEKLSSALTFKHGTDGIEAIRRSSNQFNMNGVSASIDIVSSKFGVFQEFVTGIFRRLGERAADFGLNFAKSVTIKPITDGFSEYETQMRSIQTISANTGLTGEKGIATINKSLDELNAYADKTIYNFSEMTRNIGTFTAAGVDLDTSTKAIQGIANLAAVSGSTSQQASTAMYQLSQALASGTVKLQDWNSVVNAGMGGKVFQEALKRTARAHGIAVDDMIKNNGSFRESLKEGWVTSEVLTDTLQQLTISYDKVGDASYKAAYQKLLDANYSEKDAEEILKLAKNAEEAATMVRTWTQLWETVGEALGSGWATSWRIIVGDFNKATEFFTWASNELSDIINKSSESRNKFLTDWAEAGGRQGVIDIIKNSFEALRKVVSSVSNAFKEVFGVANGSEAGSFISKLAELSKKLILSDKAANYLSGTFKIIFGLLKRGLGTLKSVTKYLGSLLGAIVKGLQKANTFRRLTRIIDTFLTSFGKIIHAIGSAFTETFKITDKTSGIFSGFIGRALRLLESFTKSLSVTDSFAQGLHDTFKSLFDGIKSGENPIKTFGDFLYRSISGAFEKVKGFNVTEWLSKSFSAIDFSQVFAGVGTVFLGITFTDIINKISEFVEELKKQDDKASPFKKINDVLDGLGGAIGDFQEKIKVDKIKEIGKAIGILAASLLLLSLIPQEKIGSSLVALAGAIGEMFIAIQLFSSFGRVKKITVSAVLISLAEALLAISIAMKVMSTLSWEGIAKGLVGVGFSLLALTTALNFMPKKGKLFSASKAIKRMATSILLLSISMKIISTISWEGIAKGLVSVCTLLAALTIAVNNMPDKGKLFRSGVAILLISASLVALSFAIAVLSTVSWEGIGKGLIAICVSLAALTVALNNMPDSGRLLSSAVAIVLISAGLIGLSLAVKALGSVGWNGIAQGLVSICVLLAALTIALNNMPDSGKLLSSAISILIISAGLMVLSNAIVALSSLSWEGLAKGLVAVCVSLAALTIALNLMPDSGRLLSSAVAILIISAAFSSFAGVITSLSKLSWEGIAKGLVTIAGLMVILGVALYAMQSNLTGAASIFILAAGISTLAKAIKTIGKLPIPIIVTGIIGLAAAVGVLCLAAYLAKPAIPYLVAIAVSLAVIGIAALSIVDAVSSATKVLSDLAGPAIEAGANLINGLAEGVMAYGGKLIDTALAAGKAFWQSICDFFGIQSPSTLMAEVGRNIVQGLINGIGELLGSLATKASEIGTSVITGMGDFASKMATKATEAKDKFIEKLNAIKDDAIESGRNAIQGFLDGIGEKIADIATKAQEMATSLIDSVKSFLGIESPSTVMADIGRNVVQGLIDGIGELLDDLGAKAVEIGTAIVNGVGGFVGGLAAKAKEGLGGFLGIFTGGAGSAESAGAQVGNSAVSGMDTLASNAAAKGVNGVLALAQGLASGTQNVSKTAASLNSTAVKAVNAMAAGMRKSATDATRGMISSLRAGVGAARSAGAALASGAKSGASGHSLYNTGSNLAAGFARGISGGASAAINAAARLAANAIKAAKEALKINSPSKVFIGIGGSVGEGFVKGINRGTKSVIDASESMANAIPETVSDALASFKIDVEDLLDTDYSPEITPVVNAASFNSGVDRLHKAFGASFTDLSVGNLNYAGELSAKISDYNDLNRQVIDAMSNNAIDYGLLGVSVANALIQSGVHVEIDGGQLMGYLAGEIKDVRRMYG